jgi:thiol:disulfide interchange protein
MIGAFLAGLVALFTPCVFPMIPMTVTFFTGKAKSRKVGIRNALIYGFSIILIYTLVGSIVAPFMGPEMANELATNWIPNLLFFVVFVVFALSFFGLFEITLPSSWVNKADKQADKGGLIGIFFMAFTLVLVSFSCTGPLVGSLLVESAGGQILKPILGMFAFWVGICHSFYFVCHLP